MALTIGQRQSRSQRAFTNSPIRSMSAHKSVSYAMKILTRSVDRIMTIPALRSPSRAKEIQDGPHGRQENREEGRDQHDAARSRQEGASPERLRWFVDPRRGGGGRRPLKPDPLSLRIQARDDAGVVRIPERAAARSSERDVRRRQSQAVGAMGPGLRLSRRRHRLRLRARAAGTDRRELVRRRGRPGRSHRAHGMGRSRRRRCAQGRTSARRPRPADTGGGRCLHRQRLHRCGKSLSARF